MLVSVCFLKTFCPLKITVSKDFKPLAGEYERKNQIYLKKLPENLRGILALTILVDRINFVGLTV